jgi:hypothetical protein
MRTSLSPCGSEGASLQKLLRYFSLCYWEQSGSAFTRPCSWDVVCGWQVSLFADAGGLCRILSRQKSNKNKYLHFLADTVLHDNNGMRIPKSNTSDSHVKQLFKLQCSLYPIFDCWRWMRETASPILNRHLVFPLTSTWKALCCVSTLRPIWGNNIVYVPAEPLNRLSVCFRTYFTFWWMLWSSKIWDFHGGDYEECSLLKYKNRVRTSHGTHYVSATELSLLILRKIRGFQGGDYEECRLLGYKNPVRISQETHHVSATKPSQLMLCKIWGFQGGDYEE